MFPLIYLLLSLLPFTTALAPSTPQPILPPILDTHNLTAPQCSHWPVRPINTIDCDFLLASLHLRDWFLQRVRYGRAQPPPGTVPKAIRYDTCIFQLIHYDPWSTQSEDIRMVDYYRRIEAVRSHCLVSGAGFTGGVVPVGTQRVVYVYFGGVPLAPPANGTAVG